MCLLRSSPTLGGAAKMSWAPLCSVQDVFILCSPKLCKNKSNDDGDDDDDEGDDDDGKQI